MSDVNNNNSQWQNLTNGAPRAVLLAAALFVIYRLLPVWEIIAVAILIGLALRTLLQSLQKIVKVRWLAVLLLIALIAGFLGFLALVIIPSLLKEAQTLLSALPIYLDSLTALSHKWHQQVSFVPDLSQGLVQLRSFIYQIIGSFPLFLQQAFGIILQSESSGCSYCSASCYGETSASTSSHGDYYLSHYGRITRICGCTSSSSCCCCYCHSSRRVYTQRASS